LAKEFTLEIDFRETHKAYKASFYPNAELVGSRTLRFCTDKYFEILRLIQFV
jgi:D-aminopeptidase